MVNVALVGAAHSAKTLCAVVPSFCVYCDGTRFEPRSGVENGAKPNEPKSAGSETKISNIGLKVSATQTNRQNVSVQNNVSCATEKIAADLPVRFLCNDSGETVYRYTPVTKAT